MIENRQKQLAVVDGASAGWVQQAGQQERAGNNFLVILPREPEPLAQFCQLFKWPAAKLPKPLRRSSLFLLGPHIDPKAFDRLLSASEKGHNLFFIEQLDLPTTQPPRVKRFLVYCDIWGIISQHDNLHDARNACSDYLNNVNVQRSNPEAGIYKWNGIQWCSLEKP